MSDSTIIMFACTVAEAKAVKDIIERYNVPNNPDVKIRLMLQFAKKLHYALQKEGTNGKAK